MGEFTFEEVALARERLSKLQGQMDLLDVGALILTNPVHIRYATGVSVMPIWTAVNLARYALIPCRGEPIVYEYGKALFRAQEMWPRSRAAITWQQRFSQHTVQTAARRWALELMGQLTEWGLQAERVAVDTLDHFGYCALQAAGLVLTDADEVLDAARKTKTAAEIKLLSQSCGVAEAALHALELAIAPGVSEHELMAAFWGKMLSLGGEHCSTRLLVSGDKTNPWFQEASERRLRPGDLVAIDTDMIGPKGYLCDISRTFLCGEKASPTQHEAYRVAQDYIEATIELCRVGTPYDEIMAKAPRSRPEYIEQSYSCMIHGTGLDDEPPFFPFPEQTNALHPRGVIEANMVLSVEYYAGKKGARDGVKLEEQIWVTDSGPVRLARYPWDSKLM